MFQPGDADPWLLETSRNNWLKHRQILESYRVRQSDRRTTPPPAIDVAKLFPELADKAITTVRLNPRYGDEPLIDASKLGGTVLWPADEPWPICSSHNIPLVSVIQLRADDFPEMPFPPGKDMFQVLWCPRDHKGDPDQPCPMLWADPKFFWRNRREIMRQRPDNPAPSEAYFDYVPLPCRLLPERIVEYPSIYEIPDDLKERIYAWQDQNLDGNGEHAYCYEFDLSVCPGTKIGGYLSWIQFPWIPGCSCGSNMEHLLTITSAEWNGLIDRRWTPEEDQQILAELHKSWDEREERDGLRQYAILNPTGLTLGDCGHMHVFVCRRCPDWPIVPAIECS